LTYIVSFLLMLGVIIFVHEFGHFITAKAFGMKVFVFSFGFGKRLLGFKWGDTDIRLSLVPLGGYVKLEGEPEDYVSDMKAPGTGDDPSLQKAALSDGELIDVENPNYFTSRPRWQRIVVYLAGPFMNAVLTVAVITAFHMRGFGMEATLFDPPVVGGVEAGTPAAAAGMQPGDRIAAIDDQAVKSWEEAHYALALKGARDVKLRLERAGQQQELSVRTDVEKQGGSDIGRLRGVSPLVRVGEVAKGAPAEQAGLREGDGIVQVGATPVRAFTDLQAAVAAAGVQPVPVKVFRDGRILELQVTPRDMGQGPKLGIASKVVIRKFGFLRAVKESVIWTGDMTVKTFEVIKGLVTAQISPKNIMGPLGIAQASGEAARQGPGQWFFLMALISIQVGILNLFPLAPLDGGHLAILMGESVARRDLSPNAKAWIMNAGALMLFALIGLVLYNDLSKTALFGKVFN
jgi:regulator of sigma E protease